MYLLSLVTMLLSGSTNKTYNLESQSGVEGIYFFLNVSFCIFWQIKHDYYFTWMKNLLKYYRDNGGRLLIIAIHWDLRKDGF
jgi:hypothetical protein